MSLDLSKNGSSTCCTGPHGKKGSKHKPHEFMNVYSQVLESCKPFFHRYPEKYSDDDQGAGSAVEAEAEACKEAKGGESNRSDSVKT